MQSARIEEQAKDLAEKLVSLDPAQVNAAVNQYFEANAIAQSPLTRVYGSTRIKQFATAATYTAQDSQVVGTPRYDEQSQTIGFAFRRTMRGNSNIHFDVKLFLNTDASRSDDDTTFVVTKLLLGRKEKLPYEHLLPMSVIMPITMGLAWVICVLTGFFTRHSFQKEGLVGLSVNAVIEAYRAVWMMAVGEKEKGMARVQQYTEGKDIQLTELINTAKTTATDAQNRLEIRAKDAGIPVDDYKKQAYDTYQGLKSRAGYAADQVDAKAGQFEGQISEIADDPSSVDVPVHEYKQKAYNAIEGLGEQVGLTADYLGDKGGELKTNLSDISSDSATNDDAPITPVGTHHLYEPEAMR